MPQQSQLLASEGPPLSPTSFPSNKFNWSQGLLPWELKLGQNWKERLGVSRKGGVWKMPRARLGTSLLAKLTSTEEEGRQEVGRRRKRKRRRGRKEGDSPFVSTKPPSSFPQTSSSTLSL